MKKLYNRICKLFKKTKRIQLEHKGKYLAYHRVEYQKYQLGKGDCLDITLINTCDIDLRDNTLSHSEERHRSTTELRKHFLATEVHIELVGSKFKVYLIGKGGRMNLNTLKKIK